MADPQVQTETSGYPMPGDVLDGRYELVEIINAGGMGVIMRARQLAMERDVAVKLLLPDRSQRENTRIRFEREVHLAKQLTHPNTIRLYDFGKHGDFLYLVMELLEGQDVKELLREQGPLPVARALDIVVQAADAVTEAHVRNIVHRDIKPGNIFIQRLGSNRDFVKVLDFGIAKSLDSHKFDVTSTGEVSGTVAYLSPEIVRGAKPDKRADVYAFGVLFMQMITGRKIFEGATVAETLMNQMQKAAVLPASIDNTPLANVIRTALSKDPNTRYQDASEFLNALNAIVPSIGRDLAISPQEIFETYGDDTSGGGLSSSDFVPPQTPNSAAKGPSAISLEIDEPSEAKPTTMIIIGITVLLLAVGGLFVFTNQSGENAVQEPVVAAPAMDVGLVVLALEIDMGEVASTADTPEPNPEEGLIAVRDKVGGALVLAADVAQLDAEELAAAAIAAEGQKAPTPRKKTKARKTNKPTKVVAKTDEPDEKLDIFANVAKKPPTPVKQTPAELRAAAKRAFIAGDYKGCVSKCKQALAGGESSCHPLLANAYRQLGDAKAACRHYKAAGINHKSCITLQSR